MAVTMHCKLGCASHQSFSALMQAIVRQRIKFNTIRQRAAELLMI